VRYKNISPHCTCSNYSGLGLLAGLLMEISRLISDAVIPFFFILVIDMRKNEENLRFKCLFYAFI